MSTTDEMKIGDREIEIGLRCAKCNQLVLANQPHQCPGEDKKDENTDKA